MKKIMTKPCIFLSLFLALFALTSCTGTPDKVTPVSQFDVNRYLGKWYEIARLNHSFEEGLDQVTAQYSLNNDGSIKVINRGFNKKDNEWSEAEGKAYFVDDKNIGHLKVSFFGPFYSSYIVYALDENYQYAFVSGYKTDYLWLLSRTPQVSEELKQRFVEQAKRLGFPTEELIFVEQKVPAKVLEK